jgi:hypothetical protein
MFRSHVLAALDSGIRADDDNAARAALKKVDFVARGFAKRRFERRLIDAQLACDEAQVKKPSMAHVMRLAALAEWDAAVNAADYYLVETAYAKLPKAAMPRFPLLTLLTALFVCGAGAGIALAIVMRPPPPPRTYQRVMPPPSAAEFQ